MDTGGLSVPIHSCQLTRQSLTLYEAEMGKHRMIVQ